MKVFPLLLLLFAPFFLGAGPTEFSQSVDFRVSFDGPSKPIDGKLVTSINDHATSIGAWRAWGERMKPQGSIARIWQMYFLGRLNEATLASCREADRLGMDILFVVWGAPGKQAQIHYKQEERGVVEGPDDPVAWAKAVAADVRRIQRTGAHVWGVEIWDEPDMPRHWDKSEEEFAEFFALAGLALREELGPEMKLGGPAMAAGWGPGARFFSKVFDACAEHRFYPDFISYHQYGGLATAVEHFKLPERLVEMAVSKGLPEPEVLNTEWNWGLPRPKAKQLDGPEAAAYFVAMTISHIHSIMTQSQFFFIEDGNWESDSDFDGGSCGMFTLHGAPKAVFNAMQMARTAAQLPKVPVERVKGPPNIALLATREGEAGWILAANSILRPDKPIRMYLDYLGVTLSDYHAQEKKIERYLMGNAKVQSLNGPPKDYPAWEKARVFAQAIKKESSKKSREIRIALDGAPRAISELYLVDKQHGNPRDDSEFRSTFAPYEAGYHQRAAEEAIAELEAQGVGASDIAALRRALAQKKQKPTGVSPELISRARATYAACKERLELETPSLMASQPAAYPAKVSPSRFARLEGDVLILDLPPQTSALVGLTW